MLFGLRFLPKSLLGLSVLVSLSFGQTPCGTSLCGPSLDPAPQDGGPSFLQKDPFSGLTICVSSSVPVEAIRRYCKQAERLNGRVLLKGFIDGDFKKTAAFIRQNALYPIEIDPAFFEQMKVVQVPTIVLKVGPHIDRLEGLVPLSYALQTFQTSGDTKEHATRLVQRLSHVR